MKKLLFLLTLISFSFISEGQVKVGADKSFQAPVTTYKTYSWSQNIDQIPDDAMFVGTNGVLLYNNESTRSKIKDAIQYELNAKGYKYVPSGGDFFVLFDVTEQTGTLTNYNGYEMIYNGLDSVRTPENVVKTNIDAGTLLINLIDSKSGKVAWQGYASGLLKPDMANDDAKVKQAVSTIFDKFEYRAGQ